MTVPEEKLKELDELYFAAAYTHILYLLKKEAITVRDGVDSEYGDAIYEVGVSAYTAPFAWLEREADSVGEEELAKKYYAFLSPPKPLT